MLSMTGYGRGEYKGEGLEFTVEIKTVNNRYLDVSVRAPRIFSAREEDIRSVVRQKLTRGHADVYVSFSDRREKERTLTVDEGAAKAYAAAAEKLKALCPAAADDFSVTALMRMPDVIKTEEAVADDSLNSALDRALVCALENLNAMRAAEGRKLAEDMLCRMDSIEGLVAGIAERAPLVAENYREKLAAKMAKLLEGAEADETRLLTEVCLFADKSNIDEELTRLRSHIAQFRKICAEGIVGRKLDFLVQEFNRESNTICSKSNDLEVTRLALSLKNEVEKVREQVQNVE